MADTLHAAPDIEQVELPKYRNMIAFASFLFVIGACSAGGWFYRAHLQSGNPQIVAQSPGATTRVVAAPVNNTGSDVTSGYPGPQKLAAGIAINPLEDFRTSLRRELAMQLAFYPQLPEMTRATANASDPAYAESVFRFVDAAEDAPPARKPSMLLAADFMLQALWCPAEQSDGCPQLKKLFADHKLTFSNSELGGGSFYQHEFLWRVRQTYPDTRSGEQALLLLLDRGWDTSSTCAEGGDQFRGVIKEGEAFLEQKPNSPYRPYVLHLLGQAYATWWTLSNEPADGMEVYVDPKEYRSGSEEARTKAIGYFEQVTQVAPGTDLAEYAYQILPALRERRMTEDGYRFFCIYD